MTLRSLLSAERVELLADPANRAAVLVAAARLLARSDAGSAGPASTPELVQGIGDSLRKREELASTAIGHGVAVPHARIEGIEEIRCAFLRLSPPIDFNAADGQPVDLVLALAVPTHFVQQHLELLAELAEMFADPGYRAELRAAPNVELLLRRLIQGARPVASS